MCGEWAAYKEGTSERRLCFKWAGLRILGLRGGSRKRM